MPISSYSILAFIFAVGIIDPSFLHAQTDLPALPSYVTKRDTLVRTKYDTSDSPLYYNKLLDISVLAPGILEADDKFLSAPENNSDWRVFFDPTTRLSFSYPSQYVVKSARSLPNENKCFLICHQPPFPANDDTISTVFAQIEITSASFEEQTKDIFSRDGDLWQILGRTPTAGTYIFSTRLKGVAGDHTYGTDAPDGIGTATAASYVCYINVTLDSDCSAAISYGDDYHGPFLNNILVQIANSIKLM